MLNLRKRLVTVRDPVGGKTRYHFPRHSRLAVKRARKMGSKEPGTIKWLHENLRSDDVFLDIGANIGIYAAFAAARVTGGKVYAIEPHAGNFAALLETIEANSMQERIAPINIALDVQPAWIDFTYNKLRVGSSSSQLASSPTHGVARNCVEEKKYATSVDALIEEGIMDAPTLVKIDVDGNEPNILQGMVQLLQHPSLRQLQIEIDPQLEADIPAFMLQQGYTLIHRHLTAHGERDAKRAMERGEASSHPYNGVFNRG